MPDKILIYGKDTCPFTTAARDALKNEGKAVDYIDVLADPDQLDAMLKLTDGRRQVPVIVEGGQVTIGFRGKA